MMIEPQTTYDTGHTREQELAQLRAELQTALQDKADVEIERDVAVFELRRLFKCANRAKREATRIYVRAAALNIAHNVYGRLETVEYLRKELKVARESRKRLVRWVRVFGKP